MINKLLTTIEGFPLKELPRISVSHPSWKWCRSSCTGLSRGPGWEGRASGWERTEILPRAGYGEFSWG